MLALLAEFVLGSPPKSPDILVIRREHAAVHVFHSRVRVCFAEQQDTLLLCVST